MIDTTLMCQPDKVMIVIKPALNQTLQPEAKIVKNGAKISRKQENSTSLAQTEIYISIIYLEVMRSRQSALPNLYTD